MRNTYSLLLNLLDAVCLPLGDPHLGGLSFVLNLRQLGLVVRGLGAAAADVNVVDRLLAVEDLGDERVLVALALLTSLR